MSQGRMLAGRYELQHLLGRGGMAEVYAARDTVLDRQVAVKLLHDRFRDDEAFTARFSAEARHVARLNHPNIVAVYDTGVDQAGGGGGQPFIVMELVEGRSLQHAIAAGGLTEDRALEVCADVCAALQYAHERGLVHRDIKPGNILLADDGSVKVTDFGIARAVDAESVTRTAAVLGTAAYLSPEQAQGMDVDARSDIYSLGVVLYEALTDQQPFQGDSPVTVAYQHVQEPPRPPREWNPNVSPAAEAITMRALAKNPVNRYQTAGEMRQDLLNARTGGPVAAPAVLTAEETALLQPTTPRAVRSHEEERRRRGAIYALLAVLALAALLGLVWLLAGMLAGDDGPQVAVPDVRNMPQAEAERILDSHGLVADPITEDYSDEVDPGNVISQRPAPDALVPVDSSVALVISLGPELTEVPDIVGRPEDEAQRLLRQAGLVRGERSTDFSEEVEEGHIISSNPPAGEQVPVGSRVSYVVSAGQEMVRVRSVVQQSEADAIFRLDEQGFEPVIAGREFNDAVPEGFVIRQDPEPGTELPAGSEVRIWISRGPEPQPTPSPEPEPEPSPTPTDGGEETGGPGLLPGG